MQDQLAPRELENRGSKSIVIWVTERDERLWLEAKDCTRDMAWAPLHVKQARGMSASLHASQCIPAWVSLQWKEKIVKFVDTSRDQKRINLLIHLENRSVKKIVKFVDTLLFSRCNSFFGKHSTVARKWIRRTRFCPLLSHDHKTEMQSEIQCTVDVCQSQG
jgi:hypothetical protein